jgi:putative transposase
MKEIWLSSPEQSSLIGVSRQAINDYLRGADVPTRPRSGVKGQEANVLHPAYRSDWQAIIVEKMGLSLYKEAGEMVGGAQPVDEAVAVDCEVVVDEIPPAPLAKGGEAGGLVLAEMTGPLANLLKVSVPDDGAELAEVAQEGDPKALARTWYIQAHLRFCEHFGLSLVDCEYEFCKALKAGALAVPNWVSRAQRMPSRTTLARWKQVAREEGLMRLQRRRTPGTGKVIDRNPAMSAMLVEMLATWPHMGGRQAHQLLKARFAEVPTHATIQRWLNGWKTANHNFYMRLSNPDRWKNIYMPAFGSRSEGIERVNQRWELDSTPADVMLLDGRWTIVGCIDVYSRRAKLVVSKTSKALAIINLLRRCILDWGVPEEIKTDNGKDYTSFHVQHTLAALGIQHHLCKPFTPEEKPHIERFFGTFSGGLLEMLPGYIGHNVNDRQALRAQQSWAEKFGGGPAVAVSLGSGDLQTYCDEWLRTVYELAVHDGLKMSPQQAFAGAKVRKLEDERVLDLLMAPGKWAAVVKKGIRFENGWFVAEELAPQIGNRVHLRLPDDAGRVYVFADETCAQFICIAENPEVTGISRREVAIAAKNWAKVQAAQVRSLRAATKDANIANLPQEVLAGNKAIADNILSLPAQAEPYALPSATAMAEAEKFEAMLAPVAAVAQQPLTPDERQRLEARQREVEEQAKRPAKYDPVAEQERYYELVYYPTRQGEPLTAEGEALRAEIDGLHPKIKGQFERLAERAYKYRVIGVTLDQAM